MTAQCSRREFDTATPLRAVIRSSRVDGAFMPAFAFQKDGMEVDLDDINTLASYLRSDTGNCTAIV